MCTKNLHPRQKFCSRACYNKSRKTVVNCKTCGANFFQRTYNKDTNLYCSHACRAQDNKKTITVPCKWCENPVDRIPSQVKKRKNIFCSCSCRAKYSVRQNAGSRRSHGEDYLEKLIREDLPGVVVLRNQRNLIPSGFEIDIFLPEINLAIELNGPCHYINIYGDDVLAKVKSNDAVKQGEIEQAGFRFIILDISGQDHKRVQKFLDMQYAENIGPIINSLLSLELGKDNS